MKLRLLLATLALLGGLGALSAQTFRPLSGYEALRPSRVNAMTKAICPDFTNVDIQRVLPGDTLIVLLNLDTIGLGQDPEVRCEGCLANFGVAERRSDSLIFAATPGVEQGLDTITFTPCNEDGTICNAEVRTVVLVQRAPRTIDLGSFSVGVEETIELPIPEGNDLPGGAICRRLTGCPDAYPGRDQNREFIEPAQRDGNDVRYTSGRYGGTDAVCVELCNGLGLCDTYRTTVEVTRPRIDLPFFDDFSYDQLRPSITLWQDEDVLINREFAVDPPSIGVATFDAVNNRGLPYEATATTGSSARRDFLTSAPINMAGERGARLTFFLQGRGLGNRPETADSFLVEFLSFGGDWQPVYQRAGFRNTLGAGTPIPFDSVALAVPDEYLYDGFQFRFTSKSSEVGAVDMWHLDYVKMQRGGEDFVTADVALVEEPGYLLSPYTSLPIRHFLNRPESNNPGEQTLVPVGELSIRFKQHFDESIRFSSGRLTIDGFVSSNGNDVPFATNLIEDRVYSLPGVVNNNDEFLIPAKEIVTDTIDDAWSGFENLASSAQSLANLNVDEAEFALTYTVISADENTSLGPGITANGTATTTTVMSNYMAYDDGSAEVTIEGGRGVTILQEYDAFVADELVGAQIRIPRGLGRLGDQDLELVVYTGANGPQDLVYSESFPIFYAEQFFLDSLEGFTTYVFDERVPLDTGKFYVGWRQGNADRNIGVGYDRNNPLQDRQWLGSGFGFDNIRGTVTGAIMLRPLLDGFTGNTTNVREATSPEGLIDVFPNPSNGPLHLRPRPPYVNGSLGYRLISASGQVLSVGQSLPPTLDLTDYPAGLYLLEVTNGEQVSRHKIVRR